MNHACTVDAVELKRRLAAVVPAMSTDGTRPKLEVLRWTFDGGVVGLMAVDGFRVHQAALPYDGVMAGVGVATKAPHWRRLPNAGKVRIVYVEGGNMNTVGSGDQVSPYILVVGDEALEDILDCQQIDVEAIRPKEPDFCVEFEAWAMRDAAAGALAFCKADCHGWFGSVLVFGDGQVEVQAGRVNPRFVVVDEGGFRTVVWARHDLPAGYRIGVNPKYLLDALIGESGVVEMRSRRAGCDDRNGHGRPLEIEGLVARRLVMPMRVGG